MENDERTLECGARRLVVAVFAALAPLLALEGCNRPMVNNATQSTSLSAILARLDDGQAFGTDEVIRCKRVPDLIPDVIASLRGRPQRTRQAGLLFLVDLGRPVVKAEGELPERLAPLVDDPAVVAHLVTLLTEPAPDLRNGACLTLVNEVPDPLVRDHIPAILDGIRRYPATDGAALLLGKTGADAARVLMLATPDLCDRSAGDNLAAFARLGDRTAEDALIDAYRKGVDPREKADTALRLGYVGTLRCVLTLARDVRTPEAYVWHSLSRRSMRVHVIEGLHRALPIEPLLWPPFFKPQDDSYYEAIEAWLTRNLAVTWDRSRPEFLYEEDAPLPGGGN